ncbi:hypothetical protein FRC04_010548 [Tulasnella sp. 424]|nr:hypothetical protein FRC04_010548 [Tulasnella sp. 424]KAG8972481.1 hypothetical protein FRC05_009834 [Tulasnella sp. 425]
MPKLSREEVEVTSIIKNILDNYPAGSATLREILQNTDDAGAKIQTFILDTRHFDSSGLVDPVLGACQGPAIIATNDAYFQEKDWKAIRQISNSSKTQDETSTGKYGLGFRSCYHITDNPHILSRDKLHILDPHGRVEDFPGGLELSTTRTPEDPQNDRDAYYGHFAPFAAVLKPGDSVYEGTAIRFPLRLPGSGSKIKSTPTSIETARQMFRDFITKELPESMLFLKHITTIDLKEIDDTGNEVLLATAKIENADAIAVQRSRNRGREEESSHYTFTTTVQVGSGPASTRHWIIANFVEKYQTASSHMARRLGRPQTEVEADMSTDKLLPHVALALPVPEDGAATTPEFHGRLFTLLPLPITTGFPLHINAVLALTSSRQNLRNAQDVVAGTREELLVEWNRVIFSEFVPKAWASLMEYIVAMPRPLEVFAAWPTSVATQDGDPGYWYPLPGRLLEEAAGRSVWPLRSAKPPFSSLKSVLIALEGDTTAPLAPLDSCGVPLVIAPERVVALIRASTFANQILAPANAQPYIRKNPNALNILDAATIKAICDYLASANDLNLLLNLAIIPNVQGGHTSIYTHSTYTMANNSEASVFGTVDRELLAADCMSASTRQLLLNGSAGRIHLIGPADVARYLQKQIGTFGGTRLAVVTNGVAATTVEWLIQFWGWLDGWDGFNALVNDSASWSSIQRVHALPLQMLNDKPALRLVEKSAIRPNGTDPEVIAGLAALEAPVLHGSLSNGSAIQRVSRASNDVVFILHNLSRNKSFSSFDQDTRKTLHEFFTAQLTNYLHQGSWRQPQNNLDTECRAALRTLPIFPIFNPGVRTNSSFSFDVAPSGTRFVDESVQVIPHIRDTVFVSHSHGRTLCSALDETNVEGEISVLRRAISPEAWSQQDQVTGLLAALVDRLLRRLNEFDKAMLDRIGELAIVEVGGRARRLSPKQVVDPNSALAGLFDPEDEVLPVGEFAREGAGTYIHQLRSYGMLRNTLDASTIEERVTKIADPTKSMKEKEGKALNLLRLLDPYTGGTVLSSYVAATLRNSPWIPIGGTFYRPSECWDSRSTEVFLCDMVLPRITFTIGSSHLRDCLGWTRLSFEVLKKQLLAVLHADPNRSGTSRMDDSDRVEAVLKEFASEFKVGRASVEQIGSLVEELGDADWVPTSRGNRVQARRSTLEPMYLGTKFLPVSPALLQATGMEDLLLKMGISKRPSLEALYSALQEISNELSEPVIAHHERDARIRTALSILEETNRHRDSPEFDTQRLLIPTESSVLALAPTVLFNDMGDAPPTPQPGLFFAHPSVSSALAYDLGLRKISEEEFARDEDDIDAYHMAEDLTARIQGVLTEYAIDHSSNEWIANADDAKARSFTFLVDEAKFDGKRVLGGLTEFQSGPALVIHNDGVFSEKDFQGLGNIGRGGKAGDMDSIGRFGLGALSFYHFTELPLAVSGRHLLLLDPSQRYLPRSRAGTKRTGIRVSLSICAMRYPDQLKPLEDLFGFRAADGYYNGTIFRFPLRTASQAADSKLSKNSFSAVGASEVVNRFYAYASQSLFFTKSVGSVSAMRRDPDLSIRPIWSVTASRETIRDGPDNSMLASCLELQLITPNSGRPVTEHWLVTQTRVDQGEFPPTFQNLFPRYRLPSSSSFGIAMNLSARDVPKDSRLFATLPLPISISLPIHIHATWILAQDRRSIRCDAPDAGGNRTMDSQYNEYLLENVIPGLYLRSLAVIANRYPKLIRHFWPRKSQDGLSRTVGSAFYKQLISSAEPVLLTVENKPIAPVDAIVHVNHISPAAVRKVLTELKVPNYVATPYFDTGFLDDWGSLRRDSPTEVATLLREYVTDLQRLWHSAPQPSSKFNANDVLSILDYLMKEGESLMGVPLLLLGDGELAVFRDSDHQSVFASHRGDISELFGRGSVVSPMVTELVAQKLSKAGVNVKTLDAEGMRELLRNHHDPITPARQKSTNEAQREWHRKLLDFLTRPASPAKIEDLANLPLLPTVGRDLAISLDYANEDSVWWRFMTEDRSLTTVILQLGVVSVDVLPGTLLKTESIDLPRILKLFARFGHGLQRMHEQVNSEDWGLFVRYLKAWIQPSFLSQLSSTDFMTLTNIPIFEGRQSVTHLPFVSPSQVLMMPSGVSFEAVGRYLPNDAIFAIPSLELSATLRRGNDQHRILSFDDLLQRLQIPEQLPEGTDAEFTTLLRLIATYHSGAYHGRLVPDMNRVVRRPDQMFDHREQLFSIAFENRPELFIHPAFRSLTDNLLSLGLQREVTPQRLLESIQAVDTDVRSGLEAGRRASWVWNYVNDAPQPIRSISWGQIRSLRFIPRHNQRHPSDSDLDRYARDLPAIVSLDELCVPERASLVWTQRASFASTPTTILKAVYSEIGEPTPPDVVRHLVDLATKVGPALTQSPFLFSEIQRVYDWLQSNKDDVSELLRLLSGQPLWLNVESDQDTWTWRSADELVFDLQYDGGQHFDVRDFLTRYRTLLVGVGAREYRYAELPSAPPSTENLPHPEKVRSGWNTLRQKKWLFDICFRVEGQEIPAHRGMLASVVPHFMTAFAGEFQEATVTMTGGELPEYPLPKQARTSAFAINSVVDYVYGGDFARPTCSTSEEGHAEAGVALEDLLNLLDLSNMWDMPELKGQAIQAIVELRLVRVETCDAVLERAMACQAEDLAQVCRVTKSQNQWT